MKYLQFIALFSLINISSWADTRSLDRTWLGLFGKSGISENLFIWNEIQPRLDNDRMTLQQLMIRPGLLYKVNEKLEAGILFGFIETDKIWENRPTLQVVQMFHKNEEQNTSLRHRLEFRKFEDREAESIRYRASFRYQHYIKKDQSMIVWEEPFLNVTREDWSGRRLFERNRIFLGMGFEFLKMRMEVGYMNQFTPRTQRDIYEHILTAYFFY